MLNTCSNTTFMMEVVFGESLEERLVFFQMEIEEKHSGQ